MSETMTEPVKRWTAKRKSALVVEILQGKMTVSEASRSYDLSPSEIEGWIDDARKGMENALRANPLDVKEQYEKKLSDLQAASSLDQTGSPHSPTQRSGSAWMVEADIWTTSSSNACGARSNMKRSICRTSRTASQPSA